MPKPNFELTPSSAFFPCIKTIVEPKAVEARLQELSPDLIAELFYSVTFNGLGARNDTTDASAPTAPGGQQWFKTVETLRGLLSAKKWRIHNEKNCPFISSKDGQVSIVVMTGDSETGRQGLDDPTNQAEKGIVAEGFVDQNRQLEIFNEKALRIIKDKQDQTQVWVFLYHYDKKLKEVRYELSYPIGFDKKKISKWGERLIFGSIPNNPHNSKDFTEGNEIPNAPATVQVEPKTGTF